MIEEADYGMTQVAVAPLQNGDEHLLVRFFSEPVQNTTKSEEAGRPIFEDVDHIEIMVPGNRSTSVRRPAKLHDKQRFPEHWRRYKARDSSEYAEGTLLSEWPGITRSQVEEFRFLNIRTIEQLIAMSDANKARIMGINLIVEKAKTYLEAAKLQGEANALAETKRALEEQRELNSQLKSRLDALESLARDRLYGEDDVDSDQSGLNTLVIPQKRRRRTKAEMLAAE